MSPLDLRIKDERGERLKKKRKKKEQKYILDRFFCDELTCEGTPCELTLNMKPFLRKQCLLLK